MTNPVITLFAWLWVCRFATAAISTDSTITCQDLDLDGANQQVCATYTFETPSPVQNSDGTTDYVGQYSYTFDFWEGLENGTDTTNIGDGQGATDLSVTLSWVPVERACEVLISGESCQLCGLCDENEDPAATTVSADCTNLSGGAQVECQRAFIFYPLVTQAAAPEPSGGDSEGDGEGESDASAAYSIGSISTLGLLMVMVSFFA